MEGGGSFVAGEPGAEIPEFTSASSTAFGPFADGSALGARQQKAKIKLHIAAPSFVEPSSEVNSDYPTVKAMCINCGIVEWQNPSPVPADIFPNLPKLRFWE
jgi:hypothetical protein